MKTIEELITKVVHLGNVIRRHRAEGKLLSVTPPTIYGYLSFLRMASALPHLSLHQVATATLLGNASADDRQSAAGVFSEVFGIRVSDEGPMGGNLF
jgi:hypothetical protein